MTRALLAVAGAVMLSACGEAQCTFSEGTGLFEIFKTPGCFAVDVSLEPQSGAHISLSHGGNVILLDGIDTLGITLPGRQYTGRQGECYLSDDEANAFENQSGHCDYVIRSVNKLTDTSSRYTVEVLDAFMSWHDKQGSFKALFDVDAFDQGFSP